MRPQQRPQCLCPASHETKTGRCYRRVGKELGDYCRPCRERGFEYKIRLEPGLPFGWPKWIRSTARHIK